MPLESIKDKIHILFASVGILILAIGLLFFGDKDSLDIKIHHSYFVIGGVSLIWTTYFLLCASIYVAFRKVLQFNYHNGHLIHFIAAVILLLFFYFLHKLYNSPRQPFTQGVDYQNLILAYVFAALIVFQPVVILFNVFRSLYIKRRQALS